MGLDTTHNAWHGSYSGFARFRNEIATAIGWGHEDNSFGSTTYSIPEGRVPEQAAPVDEEVTTDGETYTIEWGKHYDNTVWLGHWDTDPEDVIDVLMVHSDCEGIIPWRFCEPLADRLMTIKLPEPWQDYLVQFATGLMLAHMQHEDVGFH